MATFSQRTNDRHFHIAGMPRRPNYVESALPHSLEVEFPFSGSSGDSDPRNSPVPVIRMNQVVVRTVGQLLIAKNHVNRLHGKDFLGLGPSGRHNNVCRERFKRSKQRSADLNVR